MFDVINLIKKLLCGCISANCYLNLHRNNQRHASRNALSAGGAAPGYVHVHGSLHTHAYDKQLTGVM